ncbi:MAG TPA: hypothetical protein VGF67_12155 [Ktedonobacteraceae bacterium]|jgi:hypothetical protein
MQGPSDGKSCPGVRWAPHLDALIEYMRGNCDLKQLDRIEAEGEDMFVLSASSSGLGGNLLNFVGGLSW